MRALPALCVLLLAGLAPGCGGHHATPSAGAIMARAADATQAQRHFHFVFDEQHGPRSTAGVHLVFAEGDIAVPDRLKADVSGTLQGLPLRSRLVVAAGTTYLQDPFTGTWRKVDVRTNPVAFFDPAKGVLAVLRQATRLALAGSEQVGGAPAYHLKGKTTLSSITPLLGNPSGPRLVDVELWVDEHTSRLVRLRLAGAVEKGDSAATVRTIELSRYGVVVPIAAPRTGAA